jgi:hypothetical protein
MDIKLDTELDAELHAMLVEMGVVPDSDSGVDDGTTSGLPTNPDSSTIVEPEAAPIASNRAVNGSHFPPRSKCKPPRDSTPGYGGRDSFDSPSVFPDSIPPSTPQAGFCIPSTPEKLVHLDTETFYPYSEDYPQPESPPGKLLLRQKRGLAHPWAKDPRRCALRFLTFLHPGEKSVTIDLSVSPIPPEVLEAIASYTLVGHNLDFDITVLRRYGITCSNSIVDTMTASRLLGLGKEKFKVPQEIDPDSENDEGPDNEESVNPIDHRLPAVVFRYLGIKMDKAKTKLGESDWGRADLSEAYYRYMKEDVLHLPALWGALQAELRGAQLEGVFLEGICSSPYI